MTMSSPMHSFRGSQILRRLNGNDTNRADMFYLNATHLKDPVSGFEDGDITSIQALLLITVFMLTVAKRNAAWAYLGAFVYCIFFALSNQSQGWRSDLHMP